MDIRLDGRVAIVTGGGTGLGKGFAKTLAAAGAAVAITGRRQEPLDETVAEIEAAGGKALAISCDVKSKEQVDACVKQVCEWNEKVDILVNNAGLDEVPANLYDRRWAFAARVRRNSF